MNLSVTEPILQAWARTRAMLFQPFAASKWFVLGFCAFLAQLGEGAGMASFRLPSGGFGEAGRMPLRELETAGAWVREHLVLLATLGGALLVGILALAVALMWLRARGAFLLLDGVARDRAAVAEPWRTYAPEAASLFWFNLGLSLVALLLFLLVAGGALALAWPEIRQGLPGLRAVLALLGGLPLLLLLALGIGIVQVLLLDFVVPVMYLRRVGVREAWSRVRDELLAGRLGLFALYFLMKIALGIGIGLVAALAVCLTCCLAALPYLGTVVLLPLFVFNRAYPLYFLAQFGPDWRCIDRDRPAT